MEETYNSKKNYNSEWCKMFVIGMAGLEGFASSNITKTVDSKAIINYHIETLTSDPSINLHRETLTSQDNVFNKKQSGTSKFSEYFALGFNGLYDKSYLYKE